MMVNTKASIIITDHQALRKVISARGSYFNFQPETSEEHHRQLLASRQISETRIGRAPSGAFLL